MLAWYTVLLSLVFLLLMPLLLGAHFRPFLGECKVALAACYVLGLFSIFALFELVYVPFVLAGSDFAPPFWIWLGLLLVFSVAGLLWHRTWLAQSFARLARSLRGLPSTVWVALLLIVLQVVFISVFSHTDGDDAFYVGTSVITWETGTVYEIEPYRGDDFLSFPVRYILSGYTVCCAALAKVLLVHPTILMHTILPVFLTLTAYLVYTLLGDTLFSGQAEKIGWFLIFVSLVNVFGNTSVYTSSTFLLFRIWQGKAFLGAVAVPMLCWLLLQIGKNRASLFLWLALATTVLCACTLSSMGVILAPMLVGCFALVYTILQKNIGILLKSFACLSSCFIIGILYVALR